MKSFMNEDFLLTNEVSKELYHGIAKKLPIIDYHCHIEAKDIYNDVEFENITQMWLYGDHYKWRFMRACGIEEMYITGNASDYEKFKKWAQALEIAIGNPLYHWSHLELKRYFGIEEHLSIENVDDVWETCNTKIKEEKMSARAIMKQSNVTLICTTDDPLDTLEWHKKIAEDSTITTQVLPAWRADGVIEVTKDEYLEYIEKLATISKVTIDSYKTLLDALCERMDFFVSCGCSICDHGLDYIMYNPCSENEIQQIFSKRLLGNTLTEDEVLKYKTRIMLDLVKEYNKRNWVMQLHFNVRRNNNEKQWKEIGVNTGFDCIDNHAPISDMSLFLNELCVHDNLPRTILYSLNPTANAAIDSLIGCFNDATCKVGKVQHGSAWWFNDHYEGMKSQMVSLASIGSLANFIGMLTDSRSFLSYTRHEYFRRILCELVGNWIYSGEFANDKRIIERIIKGISYNNAIEYFNFDLEKE